MIKLLFLVAAQSRAWLFLGLVSVLIYSGSHTLAQAQTARRAPQSLDLRFSGACSPSVRQIRLGFVGDLLMHTPLQRFGMEQGSFSPIWQATLPMLNQAEVLYANLETPLAPGINRQFRRTADVNHYDNQVYTSYPMFNTSPLLARDLVASGFHVVSTANNHSLDRGAIGADLTIDVLRQAGLPFTGTRRTNEPQHPWYTVVERAGFRLAYLACTFSTNGIPDRAGQVLDCFRQSPLLLELVTELSRRPGIDAVIVTPHWGWTEYVHTPDLQNISLGRRLIEAGAAAVIGTHPHVIQPWERHQTADGREGIIAYSTGNFISAQPGAARRLGAAIFVGLSKGSDGRVWVNGVRHHPLWMSLGPPRLVSLTEERASQPAWEIVSAYLGMARVVRAGERVVTNMECVR